MNNKETNNNETPAGCNPNRANRKRCFNTAVPLAETVTEITPKQKADSIRRRVELIRRTYEELN